MRTKQVWACVSARILQFLKDIGTKFANERLEFERTPENLGVQDHF